MAGALEIDGKSLYPIKEAVQVTKYSRDYITRLARDGKIVASFIGRQWFVDVDSLNAYGASAALEMEVRKKQLSAERKEERRLQELAKRQRSRQADKARALHVRAVVATSFVLVAGLWAGVAAHSLLGGLQPASVHPAQLAAPVGDRANTVAQAPVTRGGESTMSLGSLGEAAEGVLLLPQGSASATVPELFSDTVEVRKLPSGAQEVVRVDAAGQPVGEPLPFVMVPVMSAHQ